VQITFKLFANLSEYLPREHDGGRRVDHEIEVDVSEAAAVQDVLDRFHLPPELVHLVLVNGRYVAPAQRSSHRLKEGDALAVWPPVAGG
jgi:sulfur carrier protein ThiS